MKTQRNSSLIGEAFTKLRPMAAQVNAGLPRSGGKTPKLALSLLAATLATLPANAAVWTLTDKEVGTYSSAWLGLDVDLSPNGTYAMAGGGNTAAIFAGAGGLWSSRSIDSLPTYAYGPAVTISGSGDAFLGAPDLSRVQYLYWDSPAWELGSYWAYADTGLGQSVAMKSDTLVVGAPDAYGGRGTVWIFKKNVTWQLDAEIYNPLTSADGFGFSVAIHGNYVAIGAPFDDGTLVNGGAVYVYRYDSATDNWIQDTVVRRSDTSMNANFGKEIDLGGNATASGVRLIAGSNVKSAFIYNRTASAWDSGTKFMLNGAGAQVGSTTTSVLTGAVAIHDNHAVFGAEDSDKVILYKLSAGAWALDQVISSTSDDRFGAAVDLADNLLVVGAPANSEAATDGGAVYFYKLD